MRNNPDYEPYAVRDTASVLKAIRAHTGKCRYQFARENGGMDGSTLAKYEKGRHAMAFDRVAKIADTAGLYIVLMRKNDVVGESMPLRTIA